ncbi:MAG: GNAT family N-acetyltransferase [Actinomycetota bacterium]|nr:GNAT family N-acetyltransferase [Actinomycetota bacterium]
MKIAVVPSDKLKRTPVLTTERLRLEPLQAPHADELAPVLNDPRLHEFIGGRPLGVEALRDRYRHQVVGRSPDGQQLWLNWVVRELRQRRAIGVVQATVTSSPSRAELAWTIEIESQGCGYAREAAGAIAAWLTQQGVEALIAHIHPRHVASEKVAQALGLRPTGESVGDEVRWSN